ncbi:HNH endonuclease [Pseudomonas haemolytica]|uniref:HNH endonuclease n=1 Tax=Pseudomonas haemolytica TaxID=2600065 RepID=A0ABS1GQP6_9PSED|nr:hypothetical protein [Pseudomonas haemolytica]MBK3459245.1 hypothetical protein [Pseudomonas haemolytica]
MSEQNKFGLDRYVPADIRREVRRRCGFGCVICGLSYYDYEHFAPDFSEAREHDPEGMTLLCSQCNQKRARKRLSAETVARANENPKCKQQGFASETLDFGTSPMSVWFGTMCFVECDILILVSGTSVLSVRPPEESGTPFLLSGQLTDCKGVVTLKIVDNVWSATDANWDVEVVGPKIVIRRGAGDIALQIKMSPPHELFIEKIDMYINGWHIRADEKGFRYSRDGLSWSGIGSGYMRGNPIGIQLG